MQRGGRGSRRGAWSRRPPHTRTAGHTPPLLGARSARQTLPDVSTPRLQHPGAPAPFMSSSRELFCCKFNGLFARLSFQRAATLFRAGGSASCSEAHSESFRSSPPPSVRGRPCHLCSLGDGNELLNGLPVASAAAALLATSTERSRENVIGSRNPLRQSPRWLSPAGERGCVTAIPCPPGPVRPGACQPL